MSEVKSRNIKLKRLRLSFPFLFKARAFSDDQEPKYSAAFIIPKDDEENLAVVQGAIDELIDEAFKGNKKGLKGICLRDGKEKEDVDGYGKDVMFIGASNAKRFPVVDADLTPLDNDSGKPYAGCYVNASLRLWTQDNKWGKRINAQLRAVQFVADGEPFGDKGVDPEEVFEDESGETTPAKGKAKKPVNELL